MQAATGAMNQPTSSEVDGNSNADSEQISSKDVSTMDNVTRLFARQNIHDVPTSRLYEISAEERMAVFQDLHGALEYNIIETPELVEQRLSELDRVLLSLPYENTRALRQATVHNTGYVQSLKLSFLRTEQFHAERAAYRMAGHFEKRLSLFQKPELLGRDIRLSDLDHEDDKAALRLGLFQLLKSLDRVGRPIVFLNPFGAENRELHPQQSMFRLLFWFLSLAARLGEGAQRRGVVIVWWGVQPPAHTELHGRGPSYFNQILPNATCCVSAIHAVTDDIRLKAAFDEVGRVALANYLIRFQTHFGSPLECQSNLNTFGIPSKILPLYTNGKVHCHDHTSFLSQLRQAELQHAVSALPINPPPLERVLITKDKPISVRELEITPGPNDIILGRGKRGSKYRGNSKLRDIVQEKYEDYDQGTSASRRVLARSIYFSLIQSGSRFLHFVEYANAWSDLDEDAAIAKILHCFRNHRLKINKHSQDNLDVLD